MDTLIDNRIFPKEMQEQIPEKEPKKSSGSFGLILLVIIVLAGLGYLGYLLTRQEPQHIEEDTFELQQQVVAEVEDSAVPLNRDERMERIEAFFGN